MLRGNKMKKLRTAVAGGTRIAGVALALSVVAPGTGGHATDAAAAVVGDHWRVELGPVILCIPVPCRDIANCCSLFDPPGPVV